MPHQKGEDAVAIDFEIPAEAKVLRERVRQWVQDECMPAEKRLLDGDDYKTVLGELRTKARGQGSGAPLSPRNTAVWGLGPGQRARSDGAWAKLSWRPVHEYAGPRRRHHDDAPGARHALSEGKVPKPLLNGEKRICYSMTEKAAGADATGMQTRAEKKDNDTYVLNGEKWFSSAASVADIAVVMAKTDPDAPRHQQFSTFIVELPNPGYNIKRDIPTMALEGPLSHILGGGHAEVEIKDLEVPAENSSAARGTASTWASTAWPMAAFATACTMSPWPSARSIWPRRMSPSGAPLARASTSAKAVQFMLAECASELYIARLMLLHIAYKAENKMDIRQENGIAKVFLANMVHKVVDTAIQLHGALGYSRDTPLAAWYTHIRSQRSGGWAR
jgi:acyl-CoA dehydrogenase